MARSTRRWAAALILALSNACGSLPELHQRDDQHMLNVAPDGDAALVRRPGSDEPLESLDTLREQVDAVTAGVRAWRQADPVEHRTILLVIHGGLVDLEDAIASARASLARMRRDEVAFYPVFVNWETGIAASYGDHLWEVRDGEPIGHWSRRFDLPFLVLADLGRSLARLPVTLITQGYRAVKHLGYQEDPLPVPMGWESTVFLEQADIERSRKERAAAFAVGLVPGVVRLVTTPLLDTAGQPAYRNMQRRARMLFLRNGDFEPLRSPDSRRHQLSGVLSLLMDELRDLLPADALRLAPYRQARGALSAHRASDACPHGQADDREGLVDEPRCATCEHLLAARSETFAELREAPDLRLSIIAHSMGTHVANELIRRNAELPFEDVVYMAAACSIAEFADTTLPYLASHPSTRFFNLTLHPYDERSEWNWGHTVPEGSLLEWIDTYLSNPRSPLDRTLGKWDNIARMLTVMDDLSPDVRARLHVRGFGRDGSGPTTHGAFNDLRPANGQCPEFWEQDFWMPPVPSPVVPSVP